MSKPLESGLECFDERIKRRGGLFVNFVQFFRKMAEFWRFILKELRN